MAACIASFIVFALLQVLSFAGTMADHTTSPETQKAVVPKEPQAWYRTPYLICGLLCFVMLLHNEIKRLYNAQVGHPMKHDKDLLRLGQATGVLEAGKRALAAVEFPYKVWTACMVLATSVYFTMGGSLFVYGFVGALSLVGSLAESLGLVVLFQRIMRVRSLAGLSTNTIQMYAVAYTFRLYQACPGLSPKFHAGYVYQKYMYDWAVWAWCCVSFFQVLAILRLTFALCQSTHQRDGDKVRAGRLVGGIVCIAVFVHPSVTVAGNALEQWLYAMAWTTHLYVDCAALVPQVVMMASSDGKIRAPIAHFVAATALSRCTDLICWIDNVRRATHDFNIPPNVNAFIILLAHVLSIVVFCDFLWYYMKARLVGASLSEDLTLPVEDV